MKTYCAKCGQPTEYTLSAPKFCAHCGFSLSNFISSPKNIAPKTSLAAIPKKRRVEEEYDLDEDNDENLNDDYEGDIDFSNIKLEVEELEDMRPKGIKFEELARSKKTGFVRETPKTKFKKKMSKAQFSEFMKNEGGNVKRITDIENE